MPVENLVTEHSIINEVIDFVKENIPMDLGFSDDDIERLVRWHFYKSYMTICTENGRVVGIGFIWRVQDPEDIPDYPEDEGGEYVYCPLVIGSKDMLPRMVQAAMERFKGVKFLCYQREHRKDRRMRIWRLRNEQSTRSQTAGSN